MYFCRYMNSRTIGMAATTAPAVANELPKLTAPPPMPGPATPVAKKKKKEGC